MTRREFGKTLADRGWELLDYQPEGPHVRASGRYRARRLTLGENSLFGYVEAKGSTEAGLLDSIDAEERNYDTWSTRS